MSVTAKTSPVTAALRNALAALASAKPRDTFTASRPGEVTGTRAAPFPLVKLGESEGIALCLLLGIQVQASAAGDAAEVEQLRGQVERGYETARKLNDDVRELAVQLAKAEAESDQVVSRSAGELAEARREIEALQRTVAKLRQPAADAAPAAPSGWTHAEPGPEQLDAKPISIAFPSGQQGAALRAAGLTVADLRAAGFRWAFADRKDPAKGGRWEASNTSEAAEIARKLSGATA